MARHGTENHGTENLGTARHGTYWHGITMARHDTKNNTIFSYKCSNYYNKESEDCIIWNDPEIGINWPDIEPIISEKDKIAKNFTSFVSPF